jgi:hypothetical protein
MYCIAKMLAGLAKFVPSANDDDDDDDDNDVNLRLGNLSSNLLKGIGTY